MAWLQVVDVASATLRIALTEARPSSQVVELDLIQSTFTYFNLLYGLGSAVGLLWLAFMIHREDLYARAQTDGLTGLLNRGALDELLARELRRARAEQRSLTVMLADIDHFKRINDGWGHPAGDEALRQVSGALRRILRPSDTLARFGGEEFAIIVRDSSLPNAKDVAERLRAEVALLSGLPGDQQITISIGLASSVPGERPESVIERCDQALYRSKREGRNRVSVAANPEDEEPAGLPPSSGIVQSRETRTSG
jgi:diguanylate cyclase (GGDEF)-like protein